MDSAVFPIDLSGNAEERAVKIGDSLAVLKQRADASTKAIAEGNAKLKDLKGNSAEVVKIKEILNAKILVERQNLSNAALAVVKQGSSLKDMAYQAKAAAKASAEHASKQKDLGDAVKLLGGDAGGLVSKIGSLSEGLEGMSAESLVAGGALGLLSGGIAIAAAGAIAFTGAILAGAVALSKFALAGADANRSLQLSRQWIAGSAADSARMGDQIDLLRQKIPLTTEEMSKLYTSTRASFDGSLASGKDILGLVTAIGSATGAGADAAAAKVKEIAERSKNFGRVRINDGQSNGFSQGTGGKGELAGTGLDATAFAESVSKTLNVPLEKAKQILRTTGVDMATYAKAAVYATNKAFGEINAGKLISVEATSKRFHDDLQALTRGIDWTPFGTALAGIEKLFSVTTTSGYGLKQSFTAIGKVLGDISGTGAPLLQTAVRLAILEFTKLVTVGIKIDTQLKKTFGKTDIIGAMTTTVDVLKIAIETAAISAGTLAAPFVVAYEAAKALYDLVDSKAGTTAGGGKQIGQIGGGQSLGAPGSIITAPAHATGGVVARPAAGEYFASVAPGEQIIPAGAGSSRGGSPVHITIPISIQAHGASGPAVVAAIQSSGMLAQLTKTIEDALKRGGIPGPQVVA